MAGVVLIGLPSTVTARKHILTQDLKNKQNVMRHATSYELQVKMKAVQIHGWCGHAHYFRGLKNGVDVRLEDRKTAKQNLDWGFFFGQKATSYHTSLQQQATLMRSQAS